MPDKDAQHTLPVHGAAQLPRVVVDSYNLEIEDNKGFVGDKASKSAFTRMLDDIRKTLRKTGDDPFGDAPSDGLGKKKLDAALREGDPDTAAVVQGAVEGFAQELATVIRRYTSTTGRLMQVAISDHPTERYTFSLELRRGWQSGEGWSNG